MSARPPYPLRLVDDEEIDACADRLLRQLRARCQGFERNHGTAMHVERIEARSKVAGDIRESRAVEQCEHVVILPPQLPEPLHRQRLGDDDQTSLRALTGAGRRAGVHEMVQDQTRFDRLAQPDFVGEQPANRMCGRRAFGHVELVWEQANTSTEERTHSAFANRPQAPDILDKLGIGDVHRTFRTVTSRSLESRIPLDFARGKPNPESRVDPCQRLAVRSDAQRLAGAFEVDDERAALDSRDASDAELRIEAVGEVIPFRPFARGIRHLPAIVSARAGVKGIMNRMNQRAYAVARVVAPRLHTHFSSHQQVDRAPGSIAVETVPDEAAIEAMIDTAFWASLRREEAYTPKISLAFLTPADTDHPLVFERPLPLDPAVLTRVSPAVERPGIHLGVSYLDGQLRVWGTVQAIPVHCFVVEVIEPGLIVVKHRRSRDATKFVNVVVLEGDRIKVIDEKASAMPDCPTLLSTLLGFESRESWNGSINVLVQLAVSMRAHRRGGLLILVPPGTDAWRDSIVQPIPYAARPPFAELAHLLQDSADSSHPQWMESLNRAVDAVAGLTAVDGATLMTSSYEVLAFGAKIVRRRGQPVVEQMTVTEPVEGNEPIVINPTTFGGTRHLSAAQLVYDQRDSVALVAGQDGRFTVFAWSPCIEMVHAHRIETLLL